MCEGPGRWGGDTSPAGTGDRAQPGGGREEGGGGRQGAPVRVWCAVVSGMNVPVGIGDPDRQFCVHGAVGMETPTSAPCSWCGRYALKVSSLMAAKSCTPAPTRLVV